METRKEYVERRVAEMQDKLEKKGITDYDMGDLHQTAEEEYDTGDDDCLLDDLLSGKIGPDEFEQDGVGNRKG